VTAYSGTTGAALWSVRGAVPEGADPGSRRIYLTEGSNLIGVNPLTGRVKGTVSGSAVNASAGVYVVRDGVALGLDQGASGDAWGYDIAAQRVTLAKTGLPWPHYFVDLSGIGGSADSASNMVIIAACAQLAPSPPAQPSTSATPDASATPSTSADPRTSADPGTSADSGTSADPGASVSPGSSVTPGTSATPDSSAGSAGGSATASPPPAVSQGCLRPELVALSLLAAPARGYVSSRDEMGDTGHPRGG
jgi:hypothetical protein